MYTDLKHPLEIEHWDRIILMSTTETNIVASKETMADITDLANDIVSDKPLSVEDLNNRIVQISDSAYVVPGVIRREVKVHVNQRLQGCGRLPFANDLTYRAL